MHGQDELIASFPLTRQEWPLWSKLKAGFLLLVGFELVVGAGVLLHSDWFSGFFVPGSVLAQKSVQGFLFALIVIGTIIGSALFWMLGRYVIRSRALLEQISDGICVTDRHWKVVSCNKSFGDIIGLPASEIVSRPISELMAGCNVEKRRWEQDHGECEFEGVRGGGEKYYAYMSSFVLARENGEPVSCLITLRDTTELKKTQQQIERLAYVDELTGLANRSQFVRRLDEAISRARRNNRVFVVLFLDLDGFKDINDSLGHEAGDVVLRAIGERLTDSTRKEDVVARLGGDEFCILLEGPSNVKDAAVVADRCLEKIAEPLVVCGRRLHLRSSIGIAVFPRDGHSKETILQAADTAMYAAKNAGKHRFAFFSPALTEAAERKLALEHDLREAIEKQQFELYYQPQISLHSGKMTGVEALIRWHHPQRGMVSPDEFIGVAERIGMINELGDWVIQTACRQASEWAKQNLPEFTVAVNISGSHFRNPALVASVQRALAESGLSPSRLELEVTEGVMQTGGQSIAIFHRIKEVGVKVAIDDFGTGYSSLSSLKKLPLDCLKVDREFVHDMLDKHENRVIIATIVGMAQALSLQVVVEGVETLEHVMSLRGLNCDIVQGYYFSKPVPATEIPNLAQRDFLLEANSCDVNKQRTG